MALTEKPAPFVESTTTSPRFRGSAFGLEVLSTYDIPALAQGRSDTSGRRAVCRAAAVEELEQGWSSEGAEQPVDLRFPDGRLFLSIESQPEQGYRIWAPRHGRHIVSPDGRQIRSALPARTEHAWQRLFFAQTLPLAAALQGLELLHASAVAIEGRAVAFTAASGTGKSSLAAHLIAAGATFVTDDVLALEPGPDGVLAHPGPARAGVAPDELRALTPEGRKRLGRRVRTTDKPQLEPEPAGAALPLTALARVWRSPRFTGLTLREQLPPEPRTVLGSGFLTYLRTRERLLNQLAICDLVTSTVRMYDFEISSSVSAQAAATFVLERVEHLLA